MTTTHKFPPQNEFNEIFHHKPAKTEEEQKKREKALKAHEKVIHETNQQYDKGEISWFDKLNEFDDKTPEEFVKDKTGRTHQEEAEDDHGYARGRLDPKEEDMYDEESERYFDQFRYSRAAVPASYSSVTKGKTLHKFRLIPLF